MMVNLQAFNFESIRIERCDKGAVTVVVPFFGAIMNAQDYSSCSAFLQVGVGLLSLLYSRQL